MLIAQSFYQQIFPQIIHEEILQWMINHSTKETERETTTDKRNKTIILPSSNWLIHGHEISWAYHQILKETTSDQYSHLTIIAQQKDIQSTITTDQSQYSPILGREIEISPITNISHKTTINNEAIENNQDINMQLPFVRLLENTTITPIIIPQQDSQITLQEIHQIAQDTQKSLRSKTDAIKNEKKTISYTIYIQPTSKTKNTTIKQDNKTQ